MIDIAEVPSVAGCVLSLVCASWTAAPFQIEPDYNPRG